MSKVVCQICKSRLIVEFDCTEQEQVEAVVHLIVDHQYPFAEAMDMTGDAFTRAKKTGLETGFGKAAS